MTNLLNRQSPLILDTAMTGPLDMVAAGILPPVMPQGMQLSGCIYVNLFRWTGAVAVADAWQIVDASGFELASDKIATGGPVAGTKDAEVDRLVLTSPPPVGRGWYLKVLASGALEIHFSKW